MSIVKDLTLFCNECGTWDFQSTELKAQALRVKARNYGWRCNPKADLCPICWAAKNGIALTREESYALHSREQFHSVIKHSPNLLTDLVQKGILPRSWLAGK